LVRLNVASAASTVHNLRIELSLKKIKREPIRLVASGMQA
jgi:hypothetical protein